MLCACEIGSFGSFLQQGLCSYLSGLFQCSRALRASLVFLGSQCLFWSVGTPLVFVALDAISASSHQAFCATTHSLANVRIVVCPSGHRGATSNYSFQRTLNSGVSGQGYMQIDWGQFLTANASAMFALAGALGGGILSFFGALLLKRREFNLAMSGKLLERRIAAHERVIALAVEMRVMAALGGESETGEVRRTPQIMMSREVFEDWFTRFTQLCMEGTSWLSTETKREVNFVQDYLVTLHMYLQNVPSGDFSRLGEIIRQDFVDLSSALERRSFRFFERGIRKLRLDGLQKWHKYKRPETERRLRATALVKNQVAFAELRITVAQPANNLFEPNPLRGSA